MLNAHESPVAEVTAAVVRADEPMPGVRRLTLQAPEIARAAEPGQFVHLHTPGSNTFLRRPLDLLEADPATGEVSVLFQVLGDGTAELFALEPGDRVNAIGPLGLGFSAAANVRSAVLMSGGLGVAPFPFLARRLLAAGAGVTWANGARSGALLYPDPPATDIIHATDDGSAGWHGSIVDAARDRCATADALYVCGPLPMLRAVDRAVTAGLVRPGVPVQVAVEARMGCARGVCLGCVVPVRGRGFLRTCREGPIFDVREIDWERVADPNEARVPVPA
ncbi:MAG: dihydroorotate dehydrogenase electron transfer subunit [Candidatus Dormibacteria bacterium]